MNSSRAYLPSGSRRVFDNPDTRMLSRGRAPSTLKRSSLNLDLYLWATCRTFALKRPLRLSWPHLSWSTPFQGKSLIPELPIPPAPPPKFARSILSDRRCEVYPQAAVIRGSFRQVVRSGCSCGQTDPETEPRNKTSAAAGVSFFTLLLTLSVIQRYPQK